MGFSTLCASLREALPVAGGVDVFLIGSELPGLTALRSSASDFPAVSELVSLAADVKAIVPSAKVSYAADWSEYFGHHPGDGTGDVFFHLDPLWSSPDIDLIGIDNYFPLADWRDGRDHADRAAGHASVYAMTILRPTSRAVKVSIGIIHARAPRGARPHADHRRSLWQALGVSLQGFENWWSNSITIGCSALKRAADRLDAAIKADLVHGGGLPGNRQGNQPAQLFLRSEVFGKCGALVFQRRARRSPAGVI